MKTRIVTGMILAACLLTMSLGWASAQPAQPNGTTYPPSSMGKYQYGIVHAPGNTYHVGNYISGVYNTFFDRAYFAYYDATNHNLRQASYAGPGKGGCQGGTGEWTCLIIDDGNGTNDVGKNNSIAVFGTTFINPRGWGVSYYDATAGAVKLTEYRCTTNLSCAWNVGEVVDDPSMGAVAGVNGTSLAYDNQGVPYVLHSLSFLTNSLVLSHRTAPNTWQHDTVILSNATQHTNVGFYPSLAIHNGKFYAAFYDQGNDALFFATNGLSGPNTCNGTTLTGWTCMLIDYKIGKWPSIQVTSTGVPEIASYDATDGLINYAIYNGYQPNCGLNNVPVNTWRCDTIETIGAGLSQVGLSMALDGSDYPAIAYLQAQAVGPSVLRIARPVDAYNYHNPGSATLCGPNPLSSQPYWLCLTLDGGGSYTDEAGAVALVLQPNGLATIGYSEDDSYYNTTRFKAVYQRLFFYLPYIHQQ